MVPVELGACVSPGQADEPDAPCTPATPATADATGSDNAAHGGDDSFDALLRQAAQVSGPVATGPRSLLAEGTALAGGRLSVLRRIGEGGMGVVYEAFDNERRARVALKTLIRLDATSVYRLKNEFRALCDVRHPNLVQLHELFADGQHWFFTMDLIRGSRFDDWVRPNGALDERVLRDALPQLRDAVAAIHASGKLHRDLKPSNVLVTTEGRVVVLDFGLAVDPELGGVGQTVFDQSVSGTPAYMAPEQAAGRPATAASDFYAVGVMLFEALTGKLPFDGGTHEILGDKQRKPAPRVERFSPDAPPDLRALCHELLCREPVARPDATALRSLLGAATNNAAMQPSAVLAASAADPTELLLGRDDELTMLREAYAASLAGHSVMMFVSGESGVGKSALVDAFLSQLRDDTSAVVLAGRCYERESVPYKAFDAVVDELSRYLRKLTRENAAALLPRQVFALARLFPVLERIQVVAQAPKKDIPDPQELQQRGFAALGELLARIRDRQPLVVYIDDLQWADQDSTVLMAYLLAHREPIPALLIASHRSEGADDNALLQSTLSAARKNHKLDTRSLRVERLSDGAAQALVQRLLEGTDDEHAAAIAAESQGSPFFVGELVRRARVSGTGPTRLTLQEAVLQHVVDLPVGARALLEVLAVAGRPLAVQVALDAADATHDAVDELVAERLLRSAGSGTERTVECYHDKIREIVAGVLEAEALRTTHERLAVTLSALEHANPEHLALHWHGAGEPTRAAAYYERAADASVSALAFDYAARQYEQALVLGCYDAQKTRGQHASHLVLARLLLGPQDEERARGLRVKLGAALAAAGHSREAAQVYRTAATGAWPERSLELKRMAAQLLMTSGYVDEGRVLLGEVLDAIGLALPRSRRAAIATALWSRARLKLRGLALRPALAAGISPETERRLDALYTVVQGSSGTDPFLMVEMLTRYARLALDSGHRAHAARALATEAYLVSFDGARTHAYTQALLTQAAGLCESSDEPQVFGWVQELHGNALANQGRYAESRQELSRALTWLQQRCTAVAFELAGARVYDQVAASSLGEFSEISRTAPVLIEDARRRGDMWPAITLSTGFAVPAWLAHRGHSDARARFEEAKRLYQPQSTYQWPDYLTLLAELSLALYEGQGQRGLALALQQWSALDRAQLLRMHMARAYVHYGRGGCALSVVRQTSASAERSVVRADIRKLRGSDVPHAAGFAAVLAAGLALEDGGRERARERLRLSVSCFDTSGLRMYAAAARRRLGQLLGGDEGRALLTIGDAAMAVEAVIDLESTTEMLAPGCRG